jgi:hypothetical protein
MTHKVNAPRWVNDFRRACVDWRRFVQAALDFAQERPDRCLTVRNEQLVRNPDEGFRAIFQFVNVPYDDAPVEHFRSHRINSSFPEDSEHLLTNPWESWTPEQKQTFLEEAGPTMLRSQVVTSLEMQDLERNSRLAPLPGIRPD